MSHTLGVFDRRVTAIEWHPMLSNKVAVGSKGGEITLLDNAKPVRFNQTAGVKNHEVVDNCVP